MEPTLILGAGINGAALARELAINGLGVVVVDAGDIASGATAYSSRLIHGGLRYLEHGEFRLVKESLAERARLLRLAPQFVEPLRLFIPIEQRTGGFWRAVCRVFGREAPGRKRRGLWIVRLGLWLYDKYARDRSLPKHRVHRAADGDCPPVNPERYRWQCSYSDAAIRCPERFVIALLKDAEREANRRGLPFRVFTYCEARVQEGLVSIEPREADQVRKRPTSSADCIAPFRPSAIVNASGAWVDETLRRLDVPSQRLIGGTKGSHLVIDHAGLNQSLAGRGIYAEAADGRPVFILPFGEFSLLGTTDLPFEGDPREATATEEEIEYLLGVANDVLADVRLTRENVAWHYSGVRPLPYVDAATPAAITRRHFIHEHEGRQPPTFSLIGGKLTTCRSLAEEAADVLLTRLGRSREASSRDRELPGEPQPSCDDNAVRRLIRDEWVRTLDDLVCRRLMLLHQPGLTRGRLTELAELLHDEGRLARADIAAEVEFTVQLLQRRHGIHLESP